MALPGGNDIEFKLVKNCMDTNKEYIKKRVCSTVVVNVITRQHGKGISKYI